MVARAVGHPSLCPPAQSGGVVKLNWMNCVFVLELNATQLRDTDDVGIAMLICVVLENVTVAEVGEPLQMI